MRNILQLLLNVEADDEVDYRLDDKNVARMVLGDLRISFPVESLPALSKFASAVIEAERDLTLIAEGRDCEGCGKRVLTLYEKRVPLGENEDHSIAACGACCDPGFGAEIVFDRSAA